MLGGSGGLRMLVPPSQTTIWFVGGEDARMRIPIAKHVANYGFRVAIVGSEPCEPFVRTGIEYHRYKLSRGIAPLADRESRYQLRQLFNKYKPDIVHAFDTKPALYVPAAAHGLPVHTVRTITGRGYVYSSHSPVALGLRLVYRQMQRRARFLTDVTVFQNEDDMAYFLANGMADEQHSRLVRGSGIDLASLHQQLPDEDQLQRLRAELKIEDDAIVVTMVARLVRYKGIIEFLKAARLVRRGMPRCQFLLVGPLASEGSQAVREKTLQDFQDDVQWLGRRSDVPALLSISDIFVLPTYYREGVPRVLLEAGALGLPLVTTDTPGCGDVVRHEEEGLLVPVKDHEALASSILRLARSPDVREKYGKNAAEKVRKGFSLEHVGTAYVDIYRYLMDTTRNGGNLRC